jgi:PAS domain S-box-containing protein
VIDPEAPAELDAELFRILVETSDAVAYVMRPDRPDTPSVYVGPQVERLLGVSREFMRQAHGGLQSLVHPDDRERVLASRAVAMQTGLFDEEFRIVTPDGSVRWIRDRGRVLSPTGDRPLLWLGDAIDVTAQRAAQAEADIGAERLERLLAQLPGAVFLVTNEAPVPDFLYMSSQTETTLGWPAERWLEDPEMWIRGLHPDDADRVVQEWVRCVDTGETFDEEYRMIRADGAEVWIHERTIPVRDEDGKISMWQGLSLDVTRIRRADEERLASEERYRALVEQLPAVVCVDTNEEDSQSLYVSPNCERILGVPGDTFVDPHRWASSVHPEDVEEMTARWRESVATGKPFNERYRYVRPDGGIVWVRDSSSLIRDTHGRPLYWQGMLVDISEQVQIEEKLRASEERYRALIEGIPAVIYQMGLDDERRTLYTSPQVEQLLGYSREEWLDQPDIWTELLHPDDREIELAAHDLHTETGEPWRREYRLIAADGRVVWVRDQAVLLHQLDGRPRTWQGVMLDITAQKNAEDQLHDAKDELEFRVLERTAELADANEMMTLEIGERRRVERELREAEERYRHLVEDLPAVVYVWQLRPRPDGSHYWYISPQLERLLGYRPAEWHADWKIWQSRVHPHDLDRVLAASHRSERSGEPFDEEFRYLAKDGRVVWVHESATLLKRDQDGRPFVFQGVMVDITAQKDAEMKAAAAEQRFRELTEAGLVITYAFAIEYDETPPRLRLDYVSPQIGDILGIPVSEWADNSERWTSLIHPDDRESVTTEGARQLRTGGEWRMDYRMIAADGHIVWLHDRGRCIERDEQGRPWRFQGAYVEMTDQRQNELRLTAEAGQLRGVVEGMPGIPWTEIVDADSGRDRYSFIGPQAENITGYRADVLMTENGLFERLLHPDDRRRVLAGAERANRTGGPWEDVYRIIARDGSIRWLHGSGRRVSPVDAPVAVWQGVLLPIDETLGRRIVDSRAQENESVRSS